MSENKHKELTQIVVVFVSMRVCFIVMYTPLLVTKSGPLKMIFLWLSYSCLYKREKNVCVKVAVTESRKEGIVLFNDALNTFYLRLYGVRNMV